MVTSVQTEDEVPAPGIWSAVIDRSDPLPLWAQVHADLRRRLNEGQFTSDFPGEMALVEAYDVSRHTVREALRRLRDEGVVIAGRGRRPRIATGTRRITQPLGALYSLFASVESEGLEQRSVVRAIDIRTDPEAAAKLSLDPATELFYLERVRLADNEPLAFDRVWLPATLAAPLLEVDFTHTAVYRELERRCGVRLGGGEEIIHAVLPTVEERELLGISTEVPGFAIERRAQGPAGPAEYRRTLVRADRFAVAVQFSTGGGYKLSLSGV
ncbi:GntR family transcriptional regulator [Kineosporia babensis]|uniref:GntR family transcriptional regulator n=1 Tax=Kineosporia babensis TaxID=499548 RepID=A0A9X1NGE8_9ACTN|nr:GntR family transcriptional regulator [Kineosporia babensis]